MELHPYQVEGARFLADRKRAYIADVPGLGKTAQVIRAADLADLKTGVVVCPAFLRTNWLREFQKWQQKERTVAAWTSGKEPPPDADVVVVSYDLASRPVFAKWLKHRGFLAIDEAHYLKSRTTKRTRTWFGKRCDGNGLISRFDRVWLMSGTPMMGTADDLYSWMRAFGLWDGGYWQFVEKYTKGYTSNWGYKITGNHNVADLRDRMSPHLIRRTLADVEMQLPDLDVQTLTVDPLELNLITPYLDDMRLWEDVGREILGQRGDILAHLKEMTNRERDRMSEMRRMTGMLKIRAYASIINDELYRGEKDKVLIFAIHRRVIRTLQIFLQEAGHPPQIIHGGTSMERRQKIIDKFENSSRRHRVLLCNLNSANVGLNLTSCRHVDILEASWTPADNEQAIKRVHRIGQKHKVVARFIALASSIDEYVIEVLAKKMQMIDEIVG